MQSVYVVRRDPHEDDTVMPVTARKFEIYPKFNFTFNAWDQIGG